MVQNQKPQPFVIPDKTIKGVLSFSHLSIPSTAVLFIGINFMLLYSGKSNTAGLFKEYRLKNSIMTFGNWDITENSIRWNGGDNYQFEIPKDSLTAIQQTKTNNDLYDWVLRATNETCLTQNDLFDLNFAFVYAAAKFGVDFNYDIFDATLAEQYEQFEAEEAEEGEE